MISNAGNDDERLSELELAIKSVWASTYFDCAKEYLKHTYHSMEEEKMAVIIQQITGSRHGDILYPNISGVARSLNYYPVPGQKAEDGVGMLSFGFGKMIVDEGTAFRFCPAKPKAPSSSSLISESSVQDSFYALDLNSSFNPLSNSDNLISIPLQEEAVRYPKAFKGIASVMDMSSGMLTESTMAEGERILTFNGILKYDMLPLASIVHDVLELGAKAMAEPVEIEFAVNTEHGECPDFSILQIRPISGCSGYNDISITASEKERALVYAEKVMGNGEENSIRDIITIKPEAFRREDMPAMATELDMLNRLADGEYVLIAAGRLGSSDRWLGIPCTWSGISKAHVIVETGLKEIQAEPSQGTHFFQNMTSLGCLYLTINPMYNDGIADYDAIRRLPLVRETEHFIHVKADEPLLIKANGLRHMAVIALREE